MRRGSIYICAVLLWAWLAPLSALCVPASDVTTLSQVGPATLQSYQGIKVLHLYGSRQEMAYQHGVLSSKSIDLHSSAPGFFLKAIQETLDGLHGVIGFLEKLYINQVVEPAFVAQFTQDDLAAFQEFQRGSGYSLPDIENAVIFPDMAQFLEAKQYGNFKNLGCTSVIVEPARSSEGLLHARNLDFFSEGLWEQQATVIYMHPTEPGAQWYAGLGTLGLLIPTPTAFNESGIIMDLHQLTSTDTTTNGTPILLAIQRVISKAHTLNEAIELLRATQFTSPWKVNISSAKEGKSVSIDVAPTTFSVYPSKDSLLVSTNDIVDPDTSRQFEFMADYNSREDSRGRYRVALGLAKSTSSFAVQNLIDIISSHVSDISGTAQVASQHGTVARIDNIQSVVFAPQSATLWMGKPFYDFATSNDGQYVALPWDGDLSRFQAQPAKLASSPLPADLIKSKSLFRKALASYENGDPIASMIPWVTAAGALDPTQPSLSVILGLLYFQGITTQDEAATLAPRALSAFQRALTKNPTPYYRSLISLFIGRCYQLIGQPEMAQAAYQKVDSKVWPRIADALKKDLSQPYQISNIQSLDVDYYDADLYGF